MRNVINHAPTPDGLFFTLYILYTVERIIGETRCPFPGDSGRNFITFSLPGWRRGVIYHVPPLCSNHRVPHPVNCHNVVVIVHFSGMRNVINHAPTLDGLFFTLYILYTVVGIIGETRCLFPGDSGRNFIMFRLSWRQP